MLAATEAIIRSRLRQLECTHAGDSITAHIYKTSAGVHFHVPKPLYGEFGYSSNQVKFIAEQLERVGIELLPLDYNI